MSPELELPTLPEDKTSPDYVSQLDEGFQRVQEMLAEESRNSHVMLQEILKEISADGDVETRNMGSFGDAESGIYVGRAEILSVKIDPAKVGDIKTLIEQKVSERSEIARELNKINKMFRDAILDLNELEAVVEKGTEEALLYAAQGEGKQVSLVTFALPGYVTDERTLSMTLEEMRSIKSNYADLKSDKDIFTVYNPSRAISLDSILLRAKRDMWQRLKKNNMDSAKSAIVGYFLNEAIERGPEVYLSLMITHGGFDVNGIPSEEKYRDGCPACKEKTTCVYYLVAKELYEDKTPIQETGKSES